jgi:hypothetical protein
MGLDASAEATTPSNGGVGGQRHDPSFAAWARVVDDSDDRDGHNLGSEPPKCPAGLRMWRV